MDSRERWLLDRAPLPAPLAVCRVRYGARFIATDDVDYAGLIGKRSVSFALEGDGFWMDVEVLGRHERRPVLAVYDVSEEWLKRNAANTLKLLAARGVWYGYACMFDEHAARNLFGYDEGGDGHMSTAMVGRDSDRYVPGLYWCNYFSNGFLEHHRIASDALRERLGGIVTKLQQGELLQLYERPSQWPERRAAVESFLAGDERFFSLSRINAPPGLAAREVLELLMRLSRHWP